MYRQIGEAWKGILKEKPAHLKERVIRWRREPTIVRIERPTRLDRARRLGYKAKQGFVLVRIKVAKGGMRKSRPRSGRRPKHLGVVKIKAAISSKEVAERRVLKKYPNLRILGSYKLFEDGHHKWYECILADPSHPSIKASREVPSWRANRER